jgi:hypothetical protein
LFEILDVCVPQKQALGVGKFCRQKIGVAEILDEAKCFLSGHISESLILTK